MLASNYEEGIYRTYDVVPSVCHFCNKVSCSRAGKDLIVCPYAELDVNNVVREG